MGRVIVRSSGGKKGGKSPAKPDVVANGADDQADDGLDEELVSALDRIIPTTDDPALGEADFYVSKAGFTAKGEMYLTIIIGKKNRDTVLAVIDQQDRMLHGAFSKAVRKAKSIDRDKVADWYAEHFGNGTSEDEG